MSENRKIDFTKLLGFQVMSEELAEHVDFQDETFGGRLGAKVGDKGCPTLFQGWRQELQSFRSAPDL